MVHDHYDRQMQYIIQLQHGNWRGYPYRCALYRGAPAYPRSWKYITAGVGFSPDEARRQLNEPEGAVVKR